MSGHTNIKPMLGRFVFERIDPLGTMQANSLSLTHAHAHKLLWTHAHDWYSHGDFESSWSGNTHGQVNDTTPLWPHPLGCLCVPSAQSKVAESGCVCVCPKFHLAFLHVHLCISGMFMCMHVLGMFWMTHSARQKWCILNRLFAVGIWQFVSLLILKNQASFLSFCCFSRIDL